MWASGRARNSSFAMGCIGAPIAALLSIATFGLIGSLLENSARPPEQLPTIRRSTVRWILFLVALVLVAVQFIPRDWLR